MRNACVPVTLTVTDKNGATASQTTNVTIKQAPLVNFKNNDNPLAPENDLFNNCSSGGISPEQTISVGLAAPMPSCVASCDINWGDGQVTNNAAFPCSHTYARQGSFNMVITVKGTNGCNTVKNYTVKIQSNPSVGTGSPGNTVNLCVPTEQIAFAISNWLNNSTGTTYRVEYGDGETLNLIQEAMLANSSSAEYPIPIPTPR